MSQEFKETIVQLHKSGQSVTELVKEYGIAKSVIYKWIKLYSKSENSHSDNISLHELRQIRKEMAKIRVENEIYHLPNNRASSSFISVFSSYHVPLISHFKI